MVIEISEWNLQEIESSFVFYLSRRFHDSGDDLFLRGSCAQKN
jgi:hypothetical protein